jgi:hypothetical protein
MFKNIHPLIKFRGAEMTHKHSILYIIHWYVKGAELSHQKKGPLIVMSRALNVLLFSVYLTLSTVTTVLSVVTIVLSVLVVSVSVETASVQAAKNTIIAAKRINFFIIEF